MKKTIFLLSFLFLLPSCSATSPTPSIPLFHYQNIHLSLEGKQDTMLYRLTQETYTDFLSQKASFPLYVFAAGCGACDAFGLTLKDYVSQNSLAFPMMTLSDYLGCDTHLDLTDSSLLFIQNGKVIQYRSSFDDIGSAKDLAKYISSYCVDSSATLINSAVVNTNYKTTFNTYALTSYILNDPNYQKTKYEDYQTVFLKDDIKEGQSYYLLDETQCFSSLTSFLNQESPTYLAFNQKEMTTNKDSLLSLFALDSSTNFSLFNRIDISQNLTGKLTVLSYD